MDQVVIDPLNNINSSLTSLTNSLTTTNTYATAPAATQSLLSADDALSSALATLKKHQQNYAHILHLRSEALRLENQIKDTIRQCNAYMNDINDISPAILEEPESGDEEHGKDDVDYQTLLSLASRISTFNTAAQREAEASLQRIKREAQMNSNNGAHAEPGAEITGMADVEIARDRAMKGMAFPNAEILRMGALGRLQVIREQRGEEAVDTEVERLIMESEGVGPERLESDVEMDSADRSPTSTREARPQRASQSQQAAPASRPRQSLLEKKQKVNLDLDLLGEQMKIDVRAILTPTDRTGR